MAPRPAIVGESATCLTAGFRVSQGQALARASFEAWSAVADVAVREVAAGPAEITVPDHGAPACAAASTQGGITVAARGWCPASAGTRTPTSMPPAP